MRVFSHETFKQLPIRLCLFWVTADMLAQIRQQSLLKYSSTQRARLETWLRAKQ